MGWWQVSADTLAESRFVISPLAEATVPRPAAMAKITQTGRPGIA